MSDLKGKAKLRTNPKDASLSNVNKDKGIKFESVVKPKVYSDEPK